MATNPIPQASGCRAYIKVVLTGTLSMSLHRPCGKHCSGTVNGVDPKAWHSSISSAAVLAWYLRGKRASYAWCTLRQTVIQSIRLSYYHLASHHPARSDHEISVLTYSAIDFKVALRPRSLYFLAENMRHTRFIEERLAPLHDGLCVIKCCSPRTPLIITHPQTQSSWRAKFTEYLVLILVVSSSLRQAWCP